MPNEMSPVAQEAFKQLFKYEPEKIEGKRIVVTGGTTGIGRMIVLLLLANKANVLTFGRHQQELNDAMTDFKRVGGGQIYGLTADTTKPADIQRVFEQAEKELGGLDILVNNAALAAQSVTDTDYDAWRQVIDTNLLGYMACCKIAAERMKKNKTGHIVNIGSMSAKVRESGSDVYVATKSGIRGFTDSLARTLNEEGIRVTLIEPGLVGSDMTLDQVPKEKQAKKIADEEMLLAEDIAHSVLHVLIQPHRCTIPVLQIRPTMQII